MTHVLDLPDDALLAVLVRLPSWQLLACRLVCRRLRDLCLHPQLWRHMSLRCEDAGLVCAVLTLAPCIKSLDCTGLLASLIKTSSACVITELRLSISSQEEVDPAIVIIRRVYALGGLRELYLRVADEYKASYCGIAQLLEVIYYLRGLKTLSFHTGGAHISPPVGWCELRTKPSLRELVCLSGSSFAISDRFLQLVLRTHATVLESLHLPYYTSINLSRFPALKVLKVDGQPSEALLQAICPSSSPSLATLMVCDNYKCLHAWLHSRTVRDVLLRNPRLHLRVSSFSTKGCPCSWCVRKCHTMRQGHYWFSSHSPTTECPKNCMQVTA